MRGSIRTHSATLGAPKTSKERGEERGRRGIDGEVRGKDGEVRAKIWVISRAHIGLRGTPGMACDMTLNATTSDPALRYTTQTEQHKL